jgi:four helix bundle protein
MRKHHELFVWQDSRQLVKKIYILTNELPSDERFGLMSQMRRAAVSVPSNIAEGAARSTTKEFIQFLCVARGSLAELETQLIIAVDLGFLNNTNDCQSLIAGLFAKMNALINALRARSQT